MGLQMKCIQWNGSKNLFQYGSQLKNVSFFITKEKWIGKLIQKPIFQCSKLFKNPFCIGFSVDDVYIPLLSSLIQNSIQFKTNNLQTKFGYITCSLLIFDLFLFNYPNEEMCRKNWEKNLPFQITKSRFTYRV
jgi:hypothetical protein